jgi:hypothetical protein
MNANVNVWKGARRDEVFRGGQDVGIIRRNSSSNRELKELPLTPRVLGVGRASDLGTLSRLGVVTTSKLYFHPSPRFFSPSDPGSIAHFVLLGTVRLRIC